MAKYKVDVCLEFVLNTTVEVDWEDEPYNEEYIRDAAFEIAMDKFNEADLDYAEYTIKEIKE